jgi:hypothetical protein
MKGPALPAPPVAIREALARLAYDQHVVRLVDPDLDGWDWLATSHRGVFAIASGRIKLVVRGWFFGVCHHGNHLFLFENCGHRDYHSNLGRIIRLDLRGKTLSAPKVIATGLHNNCHQLAVIDDLLCLVDTGNQAIRRYTFEGDAVDVHCPLPVAPHTDHSGTYAHINTIAKIGGRIGLVLHNGKVLPTKTSEIVWLDDDWKMVERYALPGHHCHDIVEDELGRLWHSLSAEGDILRSDGTRIAITPDKMTRGIALKPEVMAVGISTFGPRHLRGTLNGSLALLRRSDLSKIEEIDLPAAPADVIAL